MLQSKLKECALNSIQQSVILMKQRLLLMAAARYVNLQTAKFTAQKQ